MRKFTESTALQAIKGLEIKGKVIFLGKGVTGLKACAALDYLQNYCGFKIVQ
mgnify:FL=1